MNEIENAVVLRKWNSLADDPRLSASNRIDMIKGFLPAMVDEAALLKALAAEIARQSEPAAVRSRAATAAAAATKR